LSTLYYLIILHPSDEEWRVTTKIRIISASTC